MHKYQPRIHIVKTSDETQLREIQHRNSDSFSTHIFEETQFVGVTAYQNQQVAMVEWAMLAVSVWWSIICWSLSLGVILV